MTVFELIAELKACDPDARVVITINDDELLEIEFVVDDNDVVVIGVE